MTKNLRLRLAILLLLGGICEVKLAEDDSADACSTLARFRTLISIFAQVSGIWKMIRMEEVWQEESAKRRCVFVSMCRSSLNFCYVDRYFYSCLMCEKMSRRHFDSTLNIQQK